jgi:pimeloyl-ACP methyl ester carboxylesterase
MSRHHPIALCLLILLLTMLTPTAAQPPDPITDPTTLADPDGQFIDLDGTTIYLLDRGPRDGEVLMLLHGFLGSVVDWDQTIPTLTAAGYRVIAFDRPPFGLSDNNTSLDYTSAGTSALIIALMDALEIDQATLIGHSLGGMAAVDVALRHPERVSRLILAAAAIGLDSFGGDDLAFMADIDPDNTAVQGFVRGIFLSMVDSMQFGELYTPEQLERRGRAFQVTGWEGGLLAFTKAAVTDTTRPLPEQMHTLTQPVLFIWGETDNIVPITIGETLHEALPTATWITYPQVGHMLMDEVPDQFNADVLAWLAG